MRGGGAAAPGPVRGPAGEAARATFCGLTEAPGPVRGPAGEWGALAGACTQSDVNPDAGNPDGERDSQSDVNLARSQV